VDIKAFFLMLLGVGVCLNAQYLKSVAEVLREIRDEMRKAKSEGQARGA
jgi:hypothetical protein